MNYLQQTSVGDAVVSVLGHWVCCHRFDSDRDWWFLYSGRDTSKAHRTGSRLGSSEWKCQRGAGDFRGVSGPPGGGGHPALEEKQCIRLSMALSSTFQLQISKVMAPKLFEI